MKPQAALVDTLTASQALKRLRNAGLFTQKGRGSATWYQPTKAMLGAAEGSGAEGSSGLSREPDLLSSNLEALSSNQGSLSSNLEALSSNLDGQTRSSAPLADPLRQRLLNELPGELAARVGAIGQRRPPEEVRNLVVAVCEIRSWQAEELALLFGRKAETVRQSYLRPLLRSGRIVMTRPDTPNDPEQAYRAV